MVSAIVSYAFEAIQDCAQENKVSLSKCNSNSYELQVGKLF